MNILVMLDFTFLNSKTTLNQQEKIKKKRIEFKEIERQRRLSNKTTEKV